MTSKPSLLPAKRAFSLSVSGRVLLFTIVVWVGLLLGLQGLLDRIFLPTFHQIEADLMAKDLGRIEAAVAREAEQLGATARDYASFQEMRDYVLLEDGEAVPKALHLGMLRTLDLDAIFVFDAAGRPRHSVHRKSQEQLKVDREYSPKGFSSQFPVLVAAPASSRREARRGLVRFSSGKLVYVALAPIVSPSDKSSTLGSVVMLRELDATAVERLSEQVRLPLKLTAMQPQGLAPTAEGAVPELDSGSISASAWLRNPFGQPIARYSVSRDASILQRGEETLTLGGIGSLFVLSVVLLLLLLLLQWSIVRPLRKLSRSMEQVRSTGDLDHRSGMSRNDEIGVLAYNFDRLLALLGERTRVLENLATTDGLTRLANRRTVMGQLEKLIESSASTSAPLSVLLLDIDHFKRINDTAGHGVGDRVLRQVASTLKEALRAEDRAGRYGGEEFLILLPGTAKEQAIVAAERVRASIAQQEIQGLDWNVTVSVGVGCFLGHTAHGLLATADMNLYRAKESGRNRVVADDIPFSRLPAASIPPPAGTPSFLAPRIV